MTFSSNRQFGVEIEFSHLTNNISMQTLAMEIASQAQVQCQFRDYTHAVTPYWKIVTDASCGWELVSPPLRGQNGLDEVRRVVKVLAALGARVSRSCGLHVHVDADGLTVDDVRNTVIRYQSFENVIDGFMPASRRRSVNPFCRSLGEINTTSDFYSQARNIRSLAATVDGRYYKINLQSYLRHGTIEFRQHSGTTNHNKINNWIKFCVGFVESSMVRQSAAPVRRIRNGNKMRKLAILFANRHRDNPYYCLQVDSILNEVDIARSTLGAYASILRTRYGWSISVSSTMVSVTRVGTIPGDEPVQVPVENTVPAVEEAQLQIPAEDAWHRGIDAQTVEFLVGRADSLRQQQQ